MTDLTHNPDHYPHNGGNADTDLLCRACEMGVPVKRAMPGPPEDCYCRFGNATCQECETRGYPYSWGLCPGCDLHNGRSESHYKRLTDAEAAAEYWRACTTQALIPYNAPWRSRQTEGQRALTWHRFAHTSHALEVEV